MHEKEQENLTLTVEELLQTLQELAEDLQVLRG